MFSVFLPFQISQDAVITDAIMNIVLSKKGLASSPADVDLSFDKFAPMLETIVSPKKALSITRWLAVELKNIKGLERTGHFGGNPDLSSGLHVVRQFLCIAKLDDL